MKPGAKKGVTRPRRSRLFCMMSPISIVLCTYNGERYLDEQLRSLRAQEGVAEIVVVDDGSTDGTRALLRAHASADTRVRVHHNGVRTGVSGNFERGIGLARCEWVALSDQDDIWLPWKLARLRRAWNGQACLIHHASHKFRGREPDSLPFSARQDRKFRGGAPHRLFFRNSVVGHTILMRREVALRLMPFPRDSLHDWWLGVGASSMGTVQYVDEYLVHYRIHESNAYCACGSRAPPDGGPGRAHPFSGFGRGQAVADAGAGRLCSGVSRGAGGGARQGVFVAPVAFLLAACGGVFRWVARMHGGTR